jgi:hypothetical protein
VGGEADEVGAVVPVNVFAGEAEVSFVDEGGGLEGVVGTLAAHVGLCETVELGVDEREEAVGSGGIAGMHGFEELGDVAWNWLHDGPPAEGILMGRECWWRKIRGGEKSAGRLDLEPPRVTSDKTTA